MKPTEAVNVTNASNSTKAAPVAPEVVALAITPEVFDPVEVKSCLVGIPE